MFSGKLGKSLETGVALIKCTVCGGPISQWAATCPHCNDPSPVPKEDMGKVIFWGVVIAIVAFFAIADRIKFGHW